MKDIAVLDTSGTPYLFVDTITDTTKRKPDITSMPRCFARPSPYVVDSVCEVKRYDGSAFAASEKGQVLDYLLLILKHQPLRSRADGALCNGYEIMFFKVKRNTDFHLGDREYYEQFAYFESPVFKFEYEGTAVDRLLALLRTSTAKLTIPKLPDRYTSTEWIRLVSFNSTTCVYELKVRAR